MGQGQGQGQKHKLRLRLRLQLRPGMTTRTTRMDARQLLERVTSKDSRN